MGKNVARIVFDTNIIISALLFKNGSLSFLREQWASQQLIPLVSKQTAQELLRVLEYPKFKLSKSSQNELLAEYLPYAEIVNVNCDVTGLEICRDVHDQKFLELAHCGKADLLVTGDKDLLVLNGSLCFPILTVQDWLQD